MAVRVWFVSGPKDGVSMEISEGVYEVTVEELFDIGYQSNEVVKPRKGYYIRFGNLLIWEGWGRKS